MTIKEMFDKLEHEVMETMVVTLKYRQDYESEYTIKNELLLSQNGEYIWYRDWNEGQTDVEVLGYIPVSEVDTGQGMKCFISYQRYNADTTNGEIIVVSTRYTTFDKQEMDAFEKNLKQTIGSGIVAEIKAESEE